MKRIDMMVTTAAVAAFALACQDYRDPVAPNWTGGGAAQLELVGDATAQYLGDYEEAGPITDELDAEVGTFAGTLTMLTLVPTETPGEYTATGALSGIGTASDATTWPIAESFEVPVQEEKCGDANCLRPKRTFKVHCPLGREISGQVPACFFTPTIHKKK